MSGTGELFVWLIYVFLFANGFIFLWLGFVSKRKFLKLIYAAISVSFFVLLVLYIYHLKSGHRQSELEYVGAYRLTDYPNCDTCIAILKENNSFDILKGHTIIETGNWHYESGGDYFIVYIGEEKEQLGSGRFKYEHYKNKFNQTK